MPTRIFVTREIPDEGLKMLKKRRGVKVDVYPSDDLIPRKELLKRIKGANVLLSLLTEKIDAEVLNAAGPSLKMIANYAVGFDNVDVAEAKKRNIMVTNTPGDEIAETVAEHTIALIFALAHRINESDAFTRAGKYKGWGPKLLLGTDVVGKTLGIVGTGKIGTHVVQRLAEGFGVKILYTDVKRNEELENKYRAKYLKLPELLKRADFVSLHVPLLPSTHHLIGSKEFKLMKKTAYIINTARGPVMDTAALVAALKADRIAGAGIDVFECEPKFACDPKDAKYLQHAWNVILTPHTASATIETRQAMSRRAAENILAYLDGKTPPNAVK
jgi:glyoxylate reductase